MFTRAFVNGFALFIPTGIKEERIYACDYCFKAIFSVIALIEFFRILLLISAGFQETE